ncbi:MAG: peptidoglycan-binding protein [Clostridia bacterium]
MKIIPNKYPEEKNWQKWLKFNTGKEVNVVFLHRTAAYIRDHHKKQAVIASGNRTMKQQQDLYDLYKAGKGNKAAVPGKSRHNFGLAIDFNNIGTKNGVKQYPGTLNSDYALWVSKKAEVLNQYGLRHAVDGEIWHIEPIETAGVSIDDIANFLDEDDLFNTPSGYPRLELTSPLTRGTFVGLLQKWLKIKVDKAFGKDTDKAIKDYQKVKGLTVDGIVWTDTWNALKADNAPKKTDLEICQDKVKGLEKQITALQDTIKKNDTTIKNLNADKTSLEGQVTTEKAKVITLEKEIKAVQDTNAGLIIHRDSLKNELTATQKELVAAKNEAIQLETEKNQAQNWSEVLQEKIVTLETKIEDKDGQLTEEKDRNTEYVKSIIHLEALISEKERDLEYAEESLHACETEIKILNDKIEELSNKKPCEEIDINKYSIAELLKLIIDKIFRRG